MNNPKDVSKRQQIRDKHRRQERTTRILAITGVSVIAILVVGFMVLASLPRAIGEIIKPVAITRPQVKLNTMGNPEAPVKIIEYADFQCPYCKHFYTDTEAKLIDTYVKTGKVYYEYHSFGNFLGAESGRAAEAAYCAADQGKFWEMHDLLYTNQGAENSGALRDDKLKAFGEYLKLDTAKFNECLANGKHKTQVAEDGANAQTAGVSSTPSFLINGELVKGAEPFATFQQKIDAILAKTGK